MNTPTLSAIILGIIAGTSISYYQNAASFCIPILEDAITWQEQTVRTAELVGDSSAPAAREQWETNKEKGTRRLDGLKAFANDGEVSHLETVAKDVQATE